MIKNDQNKNLLKNKLEFVQNEKFIRGQNKLENKSSAYYENIEITVVTHNYVQLNRTKGPSM